MNHYEHQIADISHRTSTFMHEAEQARLAQLQHIYTPGMAGRVLARMGEWMIAEGTRLKRRYNPQPLTVNRQPIGNSR